jgi:hypothetical protein
MFRLPTYLSIYLSIYLYLFSVSSRTPRFAGVWKRSNADSARATCRMPSIPRLTPARLEYLATELLPLPLLPLRRILDRNKMQHRGTTEVDLEFYELKVIEVAYANTSSRRRTTRFRLMQTKKTKVRTAT